MKYQIKNLPIEGTSNDTGWVVAHQGRCYTTWHRFINVGNICPEFVAATIQGRDDFPGWTGVDVAPGLNKNGLTAFTSTYDSGD